MARLIRILGRLGGEIGSNIARSAGGIIDIGGPAVDMAICPFAVYFLLMVFGMWIGCMVQLATRALKP